MSDSKSLQLKRATEWKVFETQATLLSDDVTPRHMEVAKKWIQPVHYVEMIEERTSLNKCGLPTCQHKLTTSRPSSFRDIMDATEAAKVDVESIKGGAVNVRSNYCSQPCYRSSAQYYTNLDTTAPVTRKHATKLISSTQDLSAGNPSLIEDMLDTLSVSEEDTSRGHNSSNNTPDPSLEDKQLEQVSPSDLKSPVKKSQQQQKETASSSRVPPLNISRFRSDGSPIKRSPKKSKPNKFTSPNKSSDEEEPISGKATDEVQSQPQPESNVSSPSKEASMDKPITYIKSSKIPVNPVQQQSIDINKRDQDALRRSPSPDSPTTKPASLKSIPRPVASSRSGPPVPHTEVSPNITTAQTPSSTPAVKTIGTGASLVLPPSIQKMWDAHAPLSSARDTADTTSVSNSGTDVAAAMLRANNALHTLSTPTLLSYDPVTSSLPPSHTPLASARLRDEVVSEQADIRLEDERQRLAQLVLKEEDEVIGRTGSKVKPVEEKKEMSTLVKKESEHNSGGAMSKQKTERERALKMSRTSASASDKATVDIPLERKSVSNSGPSSIMLMPKSNPEAVKGILKVMKNEIPEESEDLIPSLEERLEDNQISGGKMGKAATREQYIKISRNEFGIYDKNSSDEEDDYDLDSDEEEARAARKKAKKKTQHVSGTAGKPKLKLKPKASASASISTSSGESRVPSKKKTISFGADSTRVFDKTTSVVASSKTIAERSILNTKTSTNNPSSGGSSGIPNLELEGGVGRTRGGHPILSPKKAKPVMVDHSNFSNDQKSSPQRSLSPGANTTYNSREGVVSEDGVLMKHAADVPSVLELGEMLTPEEVSKLLDEDGDEDLEGGFEDDLYGGDAGKRKGGGSSLARGKDIVDISQLTPAERDAYLVSKYRAEEKALYQDDGAEIDMGEPLREVQRPFFSDQLEDWLDKGEWGGSMKTDAVGRHPSLNKAYPSSYAAMMKKKKEQAKRDQETSESSAKALEWDSQMAAIEQQEAERKASQQLAKQRKEEEMKAAADAKAARKAERARLRAEAMKNDPEFIAKEKERKAQRNKLKRELKIKPLPSHASPSAALRQAAKARQEQELANKMCPPKPRPRPVPPPAPVPRGSGSRIGDTSSHPPNWHAPPPPIPKKHVVVGGDRRNPVEKKRTVANESIMKMEIIEKSVSDEPEPLVRDDSAGVRHSAVGDIEGYRPLYGTNNNTNTLHSNELQEGKSEEKGQDMSYVLSNEDVDENNIMVVSPEEDVQTSGHDLTEDEKIWKEIFGADAKIPGSDDEDEDAVIDVKAEMTSILSQNFFLYMWTTLEDLFGCDIISWMNGEELPAVKSAHTPYIADKSSNYNDPNDNRQVLSTSSQNIAHSLATLLHRAVQHAERSVDLNQLFERDLDHAGGTSQRALFSAKEGREYHHAKQTLLGRAEIRRANPAFNSMQWNFLGLLLVDALLMRKVLCLIDDDTKTPREIVTEPISIEEEQMVGAVAKSKEERANIWNTYFYRSTLAVAGGKEMLDSFLEPRELQNLRCFFNVDE